MFCSYLVPNVLLSDGLVQYTVIIQDQSHIIYTMAKWVTHQIRLLPALKVNTNQGQPSLNHMVFWPIMSERLWRRKERSTNQSEGIYWAWCFRRRRSTLCIYIKLNFMKYTITNMFLLLSLTVLYVRIMHPMQTERYYLSI